MTDERGPDQHEPEQGAPAHIVGPPAPNEADVQGKPGNTPAQKTKGTPMEPAEMAQADERRATDELEELVGHWKDRMASFDARDAGSIRIQQHSLWSDALARFRRNRLAMFSMLIVLIYVLLAIFVPIFDHANWRFQYFPDAYGPRSLHHPFGYDTYGKDEWVLAWRGARISLAIAIAVAATIMIIGTIYGAISGYGGGRIDNAMMRLLDALYGLPYLPFAIIFIQLVTTRVSNAPPLLYMVPALSLTTWFTSARIMRGQVLSLKENEYVESARSQGAVPLRIVFRHIVPNAAGVFIVAVFLEVPGAILGEAFLSVLGLGVQSPNASWGLMANTGINYFDSHPVLILVPGFLIASTVLCTIAIADGVRDALDPRGKTN